MISGEEWQIKQEAIHTQKDAHHHQSAGKHKPNLDEIWGHTCQNGPCQRGKRWQVLLQMRYRQPSCAAGASELVQPPWEQCGGFSKTTHQALLCTQPEETDISVLKRRLHNMFTAVLLNSATMETVQASVKLKERKTPPPLEYYSTIKEEIVHFCQNVEKIQASMNEERKRDIHLQRDIIQP